LGTDFIYNEDIDWHLDPATGHRWPKQYIEKIEGWFYSKDKLADLKLVSELNRHQYFTVLGKAYWITGEEKYAIECARQIVSWIKANPYQKGVNWFSALEIGIRLISWALCFQFFCNSSYFMELAGKPFLKSLHQQARFLQKRLTLGWPVRNNHIIGEVVGLITVGALFPVFTKSREWIDLGISVLKKELPLQVFPDGVTREQSTSYQRFVLDFLLLVIIFSRKNLIPSIPLIERYAEKMLEYVMFVTAPDGSVPMIGDSDDGRGYLFSQRNPFWDFRSSLSIGAVLFARPDFKFTARKLGEEAFWLLGPNSIMDFEKLNESTPDISKAYPYGGHYIIRNSWTRDSDFAVFKCGEFGLGGEGFCAHSHCDQLSFTLWINGRPVLVDPGTFTYHGTWRDYFRLTASHNTVLIDSTEQGIPKNEFSWSTVIDSKCLFYRKGHVAGLIEINGVKHTRSLGNPDAATWELEDKFVGSGEHKLEWFFHFHPDIRLEECLNRQIVISSEDFRIFVSPPTQPIEIIPKKGWFSPGYGVKLESNVIHGVWKGQLKEKPLSFHWKFTKEQN
jgi:uncharacterized heparinase superfamily protein